MRNRIRPTVRRRREDRKAHDSDRPLVWGKTNHQVVVSAFTLAIHRRVVSSSAGFLKPPLAWLIQNGFTGEAKAGEARKTGFFRLLVLFNPGLQNGLTLQCLNLRKIDEAEAGINHVKETLSCNPLAS